MINVASIPMDPPVGRKAAKVVPMGGTTKTQETVATKGRTAAYWARGENHRLAAEIALASVDGSAYPVPFEQMVVEDTPEHRAAAIVALVDILGSTNRAASMRAGRLLSMGYLTKVHEDTIQVTNFRQDEAGDKKGFPVKHLAAWATSNSKKRFELLQD